MTPWKRWWVIGWAVDAAVLITLADGRDFGQAMIDAGQAVAYLP